MLLDTDRFSVHPSQSTTENGHIPQTAVLGAKDRERYCNFCTVKPRIYGTEQVLKRIGNTYERLVMPAEKSPEQRTIAQLNDEFRRQRHDWYITRGAQSLPDLPGLLQAVQDFNTFTPDNDPYGEHDFGSIVWYQAKTFWKMA